jgi:hypothetical protein
MSALVHFADSSRTSPEVREVPDSDIGEIIRFIFVGAGERSVRRIHLDALQKICGSGERCQMIHNMKRNFVGFIREGSATILQHDDSKVSVGRVPGRSFDDERPKETMGGAGAAI